MLVSAGLLAFNQWTGDVERKLATLRFQPDVEFNSETVIDTVGLFENPCYSYCSEKSEDGDGECVDRLTKTILTVETNGRDVHRFTAEDLKKMEPNTSLNMMLESYTVSRKKDKKGTKYYVTVESFDAILEKTPDNDYLLRENAKEGQVFRAKDIVEMLDRTCARDRLEDLIRSGERPL